MRCRKARQLISLYVAPDPSWLRLEDRQALEEHLAACEPCRRDCRESREAIAMLQACWPISADTALLLKKGPLQERYGASARIIKLHGAFRRVVAWTAAACLVVAVLGAWAFTNREPMSIGPDRPVALAGDHPSLLIELVDGGRIASGTIVQTLAGEAKRMVLNGRHQVVMNAGARLSVESLVEAGRTGCLVRLALGEVYVHVEHDGNPFVVQTAHGRAVITGTTFDVKATEAGTTLVVAEGSVRFESEEGAVQVIAGQQSMIAGMLASPSTPAFCDAIALTAWARPDDARTQTARDVRPDGFFLDDLPSTPSPWTEIQADLDRIDYGQWVEQKRAWFKQQFPWIFELKEALGKEGVEADYPALLMRSGDLWRFAYPRAGMGRQIEPDPNGLLRAAISYGRDGSWLRQQAFASLRTTGRETPVTSWAAFERWVEAIEVWTKTCSTNADPEAFSDSQDAFLYLANARTLAILVIHRGATDVVPQFKAEVLGLLREELQTVTRCVDLSHGFDFAGPNGGMCADVERLKALADGVKEIGRLEKEIEKHEKAISQ